MIAMPTNAACAILHVNSFTESIQYKYKCISVDENMCVTLPASFFVKLCKNCIENPLLGGPLSMLIKMSWTTPPVYACVDKCFVEFEFK